MDLCWISASTILVAITKMLICPCLPSLFLALTFASYSLKGVDFSYRAKYVSLKFTTNLEVNLKYALIFFPHRGSTAINILSLNSKTNALYLKDKCHICSILLLMSKWWNQCGSTSFASFVCINNMLMNILKGWGLSCGVAILSSSLNPPVICYRQCCRGNWKYEWRFIFYIEKREMLISPYPVTIAVASI